MTVNLEKLAKALGDIGTAPCETCSFNETCAQGYACRGFRVWLHTGQILGNHKLTKSGKQRPVEWTPTKQDYTKAFIGCPSLAQLAEKRWRRP
jgi:hypothetical protein